VSPELARLISSASSTAREHFINVLLVPGSRVTFLASNGPLQSNVAAAMQQWKIPARYVNSNYLDATLTSDRFADLRRAVAADADINRDLSPVLLNYCLRNWMSQFGVRFGLLEAVLLLVLLVYLVRLRAAPMVVFVSGLAGSALEVVLLLGVQVLFGSVYHQVGTIVMLFMAGLALGAWLAGRFLEAIGRRGLAVLAVVLALVGAMLPPALAYMGTTLVSPVMVLLFRLAIALITLVVGGLVGAIFPVAGRLELAGDIEAPSRLYTADFIGASLGALFAATLLIPVVGVTGTCMVVGVFCLAAAARVLVTC
jgi:spermidine synthase